MIPVAHLQRHPTASVPEITDVTVSVVEETPPVPPITTAAIKDGYGLRGAVLFPDPSTPLHTNLHGRRCFQFVSKYWD